ncbi:hypothetical protein [Xanthomonas sp. MUS 060]|uniref:hypothetical protein n=1 Tax=Xanthomonas sp. MUS 060 TaxID=1588031 RepID=UPI0013793882|nr:hypothetical protein [Xanthomonas sp. MUS 060]
MSSSEKHWPHQRGQVVVECWSMPQWVRERPMWAQSWSLQWCSLLHRLLTRALAVFRSA